MLQTRKGRSNGCLETLTIHLRYNLSVSDESDEMFVACVNATAIAMCCHSGSRAIISKSTINCTCQHPRIPRVTSVVIGQYVHIRGRYPCQAYIPARKRPNKNRQQVVILKILGTARWIHTDPQREG